MILHEKSPLSFKTMLKLMISMEGQSIHKELYNFMGFKTDTPSASAFVQQRGKIDVFAFAFLFKEFSQSFKSTKMLNGYELLLDMRERNSSIFLSFRRIFRVLNHFFSNVSKKWDVSLETPRFVDSLNSFSALEFS